MKYKLLSASLLALAGVAGSAFAQEAQTWTGPYVGVNLGGAFSTTCGTWTPTSPLGAAVFTGGSCPNNASFIGGGQVGYNYQTQQFVIGLEADVNGGTSVSSTVTRTTAGGDGIPAGTYTASGWHTPGVAETVRARIGYAVGPALIYVTGGGAFAGGSGAGTINYTEVGGSSPTATFSGGVNGTRVGWTIGGGLEYKIAGHWSVKAEDLYMNLGSLNPPTVCNGADCTLFPPNLTFISNNHALNLNIFRVGVNYNFGGF
jgi:outer membrane immunogenic protein